MRDADPALSIQVKYPLRPLCARRLSGAKRSCRARRPHASQGSRAQTAHARLGEPDLAAYLSQRQPASVREDEYATLDRCQVAERTCDERPPRVLTSRNWTYLGDVADPIERDLDVRRSRRRRCPAFFTRALCLPEGAASAPGEGIALAQSVEDLSANPTRGVGAERRPAVAAIAARRLHEADETPGDEVLAVRTAAPRVDRSKGDGTRELQVRDDAVISKRNSRVGHAHLPCGADRNQGHHRCQ